MNAKYIATKMAIGFAIGTIAFNILVFFIASREYSELFSAINIIVLIIIACAIQLMDDD